MAARGRRLRGGPRRSGVRLPLTLLVLALLATSIAGAAPGDPVFGRGDVFVADQGPIDWYRSNGTLVKTLKGQFPSEQSIAFDPSGRLYSAGHSGISWYETTGEPLGIFATLPSGARPFGIDFDRAGNLIVTAVRGGGADQELFKLDPSGRVVGSWRLAPPCQGCVRAFRMSLAPDNCTVFYLYISEIKRFNLCRGAQVADFVVDRNVLGESGQIRVLPDGSVLAAHFGQEIRRVNPAGTGTLRVYDAPGENAWTYLDVDPDRTSFWASSGNNVYRFDLSSGQSTRFPAKVERFLAGLAVAPRAALLPAPSQTDFTDTFTTVGQQRAHVVPVAATTRSVDVTVRWQRPGDRFDLTGFRLAARRAFAVGRLPAKLKITKLKITRTSLTVRVAGLRAGRLSFRVVARRVTAPAKVTTRVAARRG